MQGLEPRCVPTVMLSCAGTAHTRAPTRAHTHTLILLSHFVQLFYIWTFFFLIWKTSEHFFFTDSKVSVAEIH